MQPVSGQPTPARNWSRVGLRNKIDYRGGGGVVGTGITRPLHRAVRTSDAGPMPSSEAAGYLPGL